MRFPLFLEKHVVEKEYTNRLYKPFHFLIVVLVLGIYHRM
jgi:hypothetical protein